MSAAPSHQVPLPPIPGLGELDVDIRKGPTGSLGINVRQSQLCLQVRLVFPTWLDEVPVLLWPAKRLPRRHATTLYPLPLRLGSAVASVVPPATFFLLPACVLPTLQGRSVTKVANFSLRSQERVGLLREVGMFGVARVLLLCRVS